MKRMPKTPKPSKMKKGPAAHKGPMPNCQSQQGQAAMNKKAQMRNGGADMEYKGG